jgi:two-component sensor histidine kinase
LSGRGPFEDQREVAVGAHRAIDVAHPAPIGAEAADVAALAAAMRRLSNARSLTEIMDVVTHAARTLLQADGATFVLRDGDRCFYADEDAVSPLWKGRRFPMSACVSGWCMIHGEPVRIPDIYKDPRVPADAYRPTFVRSLMMVPVRPEAPIAAMGVYWSVVRQATPAELERLQTLASSAELAVAYIGLMETGSDRRRRPRPAPRPSMRRPEDLGQAAGQAGQTPGEIVQRLLQHGLRPNSRQAYAFAVGCVALATLARLGIGALGVRDLAPFSTYYPAALIAVLVGGVRAGALAILLGGALAYWAFLPPYFHAARLDLRHALNMALYLFSSGLIVWASGRYRLALSRLTLEDARHITLARELEHRSRNMLAIAYSVVNQSLRGDTLQARTINARLRASLASRDIIRQPAHQTTSLRETLVDALEPFSLTQFVLEGEDGPVSGSVQSLLALAVHELATNALKYGALSTPEGRIAVRWSMDAGRVVFRWDETGGPPVTPPRKRGYGSIFLGRLIEAAGGALDLTFRPGGLAAEISLPIPPPARH